MPHHKHLRPLHDNVAQEEAEAMREHQEEVEEAEEEVAVAEDAEDLHSSRRTTRQHQTRLHLRVFLVEAPSVAA